MHIHRAGFPHKIIIPHFGENFLPAHHFAAVSNEKAQKVKLLVCQFKGLTEMCIRDRSNVGMGDIMLEQGGHYEATYTID